VARPVGFAESKLPFAGVTRPDTADYARVGRPDPSLFPAGRWRTLMRGALDGLGAQLASDHPAGGPALRNAVADWLSTSRGLAVAPDQVILVNGRQQALHIVAHLALHPGARAVVEDPCDAAAAAALGSEAAELVRVPVDADGLCTDCLPAGNVALAHVTPEHQRPLGVTLARGRRIALLTWAARSGALVLEEDCEGELRYGAMNVPSLLSLDAEERVILLGGFCTSLGPWLGLAYLVLPRRLVAAALAARRMIDDSRRHLEETALAELLSSGGYARHVHRLGKAYASRRDALLVALRAQFGEPAMTWGAQAGLHLAWFPPDDAGSPGYLASLARRCGLEAAALPADARGRPPGAQVVLLGFGALAERQIAARVAQFAVLAQANRVDTALSAD
jgi:GntR family transcriptional regulator/MocR family aminotransferase